MPLSTLVRHAAPQSIPDGLVTRPAPSPSRRTVTTRACAVRSKRAVAVLAPSMVRRQLCVPLQSPSQPAKATVPEAVARYTQRELLQAFFRTKREIPRTERCQSG